MSSAPSKMAPIPPVGYILPKENKQQEVHELDPALAKDDEMERDKRIILT